MNNLFVLHSSLMWLVIGCPLVKHSTASFVLLFYKYWEWQIHDKDFIFFSFRLINPGSCRSLE